MYGTKKVLMTVITIAFVLAGNLTAVDAQEQAANLFIGNGTGGEITALIISPAKEKYPKDENSFAIQNLAVKDEAVFGVLLPPQFNGINTFDIDVVSKGKRYVKKGVKVTLRDGKTPTLELSRKGKDSTRGLIGAATGGVGGVIAVVGITTALYTGTIMIGQALYVAALAEALCVAGSIVGGGMLSGIGVVAAIPVALGVGGFLIGRALTPRDLDVQVFYNI